MKKQLVIALSVASAAALGALSACSSGGSSGNASTGAAVTGTLTQAAVSDIGTNNPVGKFESNFATSGTQISLDCGTSGAYTGTVGTDGSFSVAGVPTGVPCTFSFTSTTNKTIKCRVQFQSSDYDLNNNPLTTSTAPVSSSVALGNITCDTTGNITIPTSQAANVAASSSVPLATAFDFTGTWTIAAYDGTLPTGYQTPQAGQQNGPSVGQVITLIRFHGNKFTPSTGQCTPAINVTCPTTAGTVDTNTDGYGMSIWGGDYNNSIGACGGNTGFTADEARAYAHLSLDSTPPSIAGHSLTYAHYAWATPSGFGGDTGWTKPWMYTGATSNWSVSDCQPVVVTATSGGATKQAFACWVPVVHNGSATASYVWQVGLMNSGGCVDSSNNPVMVTNWSNLTGSCSSTASTFNTNFTTNSCTYTGSVDGTSAATTFTCSFTGGAFDDVSTNTGATQGTAPTFSSPHSFASGDWPGQPRTFLAQNATCANTTTTEAQLIAAGTAAAKKELLIRYQCYANAYWQHSSNGAGSTTCARNYNFDWSTNDYTKFVLGDDRSMKPQNAFITDRVFYGPDGQTAFLRNVDTRFQTVPTSGGSQLCQVNNTTELKFQKISSTKVLVNFLQYGTMADRSATCQGAVAAAMAGGGNISNDTQGLNNLYRNLTPQRMLFYITQ